ASSAAPQPPKTSQKVPMNSAVALFISVIIKLLSVSDRRHPSSGSAVHFRLQAKHTQHSVYVLYLQTVFAGVDIELKFYPSHARNGGDHLGRLRGRTVQASYSHARGAGARQGYCNIFQARLLLFFQHFASAEGLKPRAAKPVAFAEPGQQSAPFR